MFCSLRRVHADIFMLACVLLNEQNNEPILLSIITYWENKMYKRKRSIRVFRFSGIFSNSAISLRIRARGKKYLSDIVLDTLFLLVNLKIQSFLAINSNRILFSRGLVINRWVPTL